MPASHLTPLTPDVKQRLKAIWEDPQSTATILVVLFLDLFNFWMPEEGEEAKPGYWAPQTILMELEEDLGAHVPMANLDRLMAGLQLLKSDEFFQNLPTFNELCVILAGGPHQPGVFVPADAASCAWGISEALLLNPPTEEEPFSDEIRAYIGKTLEDEGIMTPPDILRIAIHDPQYAENVNYAFQDDPELLSAISHSEHEKTDEINQFVKSKLRHTLQTLANAPLIQGNTEGITQRLFSALQ